MNVSMIRPVTSRPTNRWRLVRDGALLVVAAALAALGISLARLDASQGPGAQHINVQWAPGVSSEERSRIEQERGLHSGRQNESGTWLYGLRDRSRENIARLIRDPRVADTHLIDRQKLTVILDRPGLDPRLRALLETDRADTLAMGLMLAGVVLAVIARRVVILVPLLLLQAAHGGAARAARWIAWAVPAAIAAPFDRKYESAAPHRWEFAVAVVIALVILKVQLTYGPFEDEIVQATIMPNQMFYRALFRGEWLYWLNNLGFGSPMPLGDPLMFHPVFAPLAAFASLRVTLSAVWIVHSVVMAAYLLRLMAVSGVTGPILRLLLLLLYFCSVQYSFYIYETDWVQMAVTWTLYPVVVFYLRSAIRGGAQTDVWRTAAWLGLVFGFWIINAHPGYIIPLVLVLVVYTVVAAPLDRRVYLCLAVGAVLCAAIASARIYTLLHEVQLFPPGGESREGGTPSDYLSALLAPYIPLGGRGPFIGVGVAIALVVACFMRSSLRDPHLRGCAAALVASILFNLIPHEILARVLPAVGGYLFRDGITFFSVLLAGAVIQRGFGHHRALVRGAALALVLLQVFQQYSLVGGHYFADRGNGLLFYRYQEHPVRLARVLVDRAAEYGPRVYFSELVDEYTRGNLSPDGIHFSSDLVLHGLNPVNGWFKNVSMTTLYPPEALMESFILGDRHVILNPALLDVLGINLVLSTERETGAPPGLRVLDRPWVHDRGLHDLVLLANPTAWPRAVLLAPEAADLRLPVRPGCGHTAALCLDYEAIARTRLDGDVVLTSIEDGRFVARVPPSDRERLLFMSVLHRPEWRATAAGAHLPVRPVAGAFIGVSVPPAVSHITVEYVPRTQIVLTWFSNIVFFALVGIALVSLRLPFRRWRSQ
jgi:hypothetical protein